MDLQDLRGIIQAAPEGLIDWRNPTPLWMIAPADAAAETTAVIMLIRKAAPLIREKFKKTG